MTNVVTHRLLVVVDGSVRLDLLLQAILLLLPAVCLIVAVGEMAVVEITSWICMPTAVFVREEEMCNFLSQVDEEETGADQKFSEWQDAPHSVMLLQRRKRQSLEKQIKSGKWHRKVSSLS